MSKDTFVERWRKPVILHEVEHDTSWELHVGDGRKFTGWDATLSLSDMRRMAEGRICIRCYEPFEVPFPDACGLCGYEVAQLQPEEYTRRYGGERWLGPAMTWEDELDDFAERAAKMNYERRVDAKQHQIWLPGRNGDE